MDVTPSLKREKSITILGSTGSIGRSTLDVVNHLSDRLSATHLSAHSNVSLLEQQIRTYHPLAVAVLQEEAASRLKRILGESTEVLAGEDGLMDLAGRTESDIVLNALVGFCGLRPTLRAIDAGKDIALANKETIVVAGELVTRKAGEKGVRLLPVDSEHSAILQCLQGENRSEVARLILTASGGPFLRYDKHRLSGVTAAEALNHPTWKMGKKITIDSATLMNKGLEVIEASRLFGIPPHKIEILIHPQSIVHSMVEFADGSVKALLGPPDMRIPIQYALTFPERPAAQYRKMDLAELGNLTFLKPDTGTFRCLPLAFRALEMGGTAPAVLNAANEVAVRLFLDQSIPFTAISAIIENALDAHRPIRSYTLDDVLNVDRETRERILRRFRDSHSHGDPVGQAVSF